MFLVQYNIAPSSEPRTYLQLHNISMSSFGDYDRKKAYFFA